MKNPMDICPYERVARLAAYAGVPVEFAERLLWAEEPNLDAHIRWLEAASDREIIFHLVTEYIPDDDSE